MERFRPIIDGVQNFKKSIKDKREQRAGERRQKKEEQRKQRVLCHPHTPECTLSGDIELFNEKYVSVIPRSDPREPGMYDLVDYESRCTECGVTSTKAEVDALAEALLL